MRTATGQDQCTIEFLQKEPQVQQMQGDISQFLKRWLPSFIEANRSYITIAIGCTGGQHRSVYMVEQLAALFKQDYPLVQIRHRELGGHH